MNEGKLNAWLSLIVMVAMVITIQGAPWPLEGWATVNAGLVGVMFAILAALDLTFPDRFAVFLHPAKGMWSVTRRRVLWPMTTRTCAAHDLSWIEIVHYAGDGEVYVDVYWAQGRTKRGKRIVISENFDTDAQEWVAASKFAGPLNLVDKISRTSRP